MKEQTFPQYSKFLEQDLNELSSTSTKTAIHQFRVLLQQDGYGTYDIDRTQISKIPGSSLCLLRQSLLFHQLLKVDYVVQIRNKPREQTHTETHISDVHKIL